MPILTATGCRTVRNTFSAGTSRCLAHQGAPTATTSGGNIILTFTRDDASETPDVTLTVETGTDLLTWPTVFTIGPNTAASSPGVSCEVNHAPYRTF